MKNKSVLFVLISAIAVSSCGICKQDKIGGVKVYDIDYYSGNQYDESGKAEFNYDLFYRNDPKVGGPDPFVFDNTERDGYYYIYSTIGAFFIGRSKDLMNWESMGSALPEAAVDANKNLNQLFKRGDMWAPEVVYDDDTGKYLFFCSATPVYGNVAYQSNSYVGISDNPAGPFYICNFKRSSTDINYNEGFVGVGEENLHTFDPGVYNESFAQYVFLEPGKLNDALIKVGLVSTTSKYVRTIDFHPFQDPDNGKKYMYFVNENSTGASFTIYGMEMENWLKPKWETFGAMVTAGSYTIEDALNKVPNKPSYETSCVNEGPAVVKHNNKYYLVFSNGYYTDSTYCLIQAIADSPLGPYKKLEEDENALFMSSQIQGNESVSGTGHNGFVTVDGELYCIYHKHRSYAIGGADRVAAIDKIKWITIKDHNGNDLDVMYSNGPTDTVQPRIEKYSDYRNIALDAKISTNGSLYDDSNSSYLNDDLLSTYKSENAVISNYVKETVIDDKTTFKFSFDTPQTVRSVMAYNSKNETRIFRKIDEILIEWEYEGKKGYSRMKDVEFNKEFYEEIEEFHFITYVTPGSNAYAEFNEIKGVKSVSLTFSIPEYSEEQLVGLSEIRILGRK